MVYVLLFEDQQLLRFYELFCNEEMETIMNNEHLALYFIIQSQLFTTLLRGICRRQNSVGREIHFDSLIKF